MESLRAAETSKVASDKGRPVPLGLGTRRLSWHLDTLPIYVIHVVLLAFFMLPFLWMLSGSLKSQLEAYAVPPTLIPREWLWSNYPTALTYVPFASYFGNSLIVCAGAIAGTLLSCSLVAYSLARIRWWGQGPVFALVLASMMLPSQATLIPLFVTFRRLGWIGTFAPLIVPTFFGDAFFIFLMRQFFLTIPEELLDAARIDGASEMRIYAQIVLPLSKPVLGTVTLFTFLSNWNDFLKPLLYLTNEKLWTVAIGLRGFQGQHGWKWELLMAAAVVSSIPTMVIYGLMQRSFVRGIVATGFR
jgi:multiple sugar transport system permease protein